MVTRKKKVCPVCGAEFEGPGALSRKDNKTEICSVCGVAEALADFFKFEYKEEN